MGACSGSTSRGQTLVFSTGEIEQPYVTRTNRLGTPVTAYVAREGLGVLKARHAQMDERALEAPQKRAAESRN